MSKRRDVLLAVKGLATAAVAYAKVRGFDQEAEKPQRADPGGDIIGQPGEPGEPEVDLSPLTYHYEHSIPVEIAAPPGVADPDAWLDAAMGLIGAAVAANRTLGGLCNFLEAVAPELDDRPVDGAVTRRWASFEIVASYSTEDPLN